ncbi:MAG: sigma-70 family RNA polymerase sigma factor [Cyanobacteria bacterium J06634_6]
MAGGSSAHELNQRLQALVAEACTHELGSVQRQAAFAQIVTLVMRSGKLWCESTPYYADALQEMWRYSFEYIDHPEDGYKPDVCRVTTWLDDRLKKTLRRYRDRKGRQNERHLSPLQTAGGLVDPIDQLVAPADPHSALRLWSRLLSWVQEDPDETLRSRICKQYPHISAQCLLMRRLPPDERSWDDISAEFSADKKYIAQWYSRYCNPLLRQWGKAQGYLTSKCE